MDISTLFSADGLAMLALAVLIISAIVAYVVLLRMERPETLLPPEHCHIMGKTANGMGAAVDTNAHNGALSCNGSHDWKILHEKVLEDDSSLITFWCRHCGTVTLQRDDVGQRNTSTVWKYEPDAHTQGRPLLIMHALPELPMAWDITTGTLTLIDIEDNGRIVFTPSFADKVLL